VTHTDVSPQKNTGLLTPSNRTQASILTERIRRDIIAGVFPPNSKLKLRELSERYEAGTVPLREALSRLVLSGFVHAEDQRGFRVTNASAEELLDITWVRLDAEANALRRSIENGTLKWESSVIAALHTLNNTPMRTSDANAMLSPAWEAAHDAFHAALISACNSPWLLRICELLREQSDRYRQMSVMSESTVNRDVAKEHQELCDAVLERDAEKACQLLNAHFMATTELALERLRKLAS
jgi:DNA-binding GntR family transcriptional regulator